MNTIILFAEILVIFGSLLIVKKLFGKEGMLAWMAVASVLANVITAKNATVLGLNTAIGSVMFASTFLATDIISECYGKQEAKRAVYFGLFGTLMLIISTQIALLYKPSMIDYADGAMQTLFSLNLRISVSSAVMYFIANIADVLLYNKIKEKTGERLMWLRNNVSTILCNCLENFFFIFFAFVGIYSMKDILIIALSTSVIETIIGICDTPFLYLAKRI